MPDLSDPQVTLGSDADLALCIHRIEDGAAVHVIRYDYDEAGDCVPPLERLELAIRLPERFSTAEALSPASCLRAALTVSGETHRLVLQDVPLYAVVVLTP
jgi:hypothetical protein